MTQRTERPALPYRWVCVTWLDTAGAPAWGKSAKAAPARAYTEGWLVHEAEHYIVVSNSYCDGEFGNRDAIPRGCIVRPARLRHAPESLPKSTGKQ